MASRSDNIHEKRTPLLVALVAVLALPFIPFASQYLPSSVQLQNPFVSSGPVVALDYGPFEGRAQDGIEQFLGIPYAAPPVDLLRFAKPHLPIASTRTRKATSYGPGCHPQYLTMNPDMHLPQPAVDADVRSEDCLTINVYKPENANPDSKLPVIFFIHGGGFAMGTTSKMDVGQEFVNRTMALGKPIVYVSANYRLNAFGFLAGNVIEAEGGINAGMQDQRMALKWIQKYITLFGGDPEKVTLWGQSAGAISIGLHMVANGGNNEGMFRGAVMQSGGPTPIGTIAEGQSYFEHLASLAGCSPSNSTSSMIANTNSLATDEGKLSCLRKVPTDALVDAINRSPNLLGYSSIRLAWQPRVDGTMFKMDPVESARKGLVAKVSFISGVCDDEGTLFSMNNFNITSNEQFVEYIKYLTRITDKQAARLARVYSENPALGAPYDTGDKHVLSPQYKRLASFQGDWIFHASTRNLLKSTMKTHNSWAYLYKRYKHASFLGSTHGTDFDALKVEPKGYDFLLNFVYNLDPNVPLHPDSAIPTPWPEYRSTSDGTFLTYLDGNAFGLAQDDKRKEAYETMMEVQLELAREKRRL